LFQGTGNVLQQSGNLFWDSTNNRLGIGGTPTTTLDVIGGASSGFDAIKFKSQYSTIGYLGSDNGRIWLSTGTGGTGTSLNMDVSRITFRVNNSEVARFADATRNLLINTTTDAGFRLDVNGTARVQGNLTLGTGGFIYGDTTTPFIRLSNAVGSQFGYGTNIFSIGDAGFRFNTSASIRPLFYRAAWGMRIQDNNQNATDPQFDGLQAVLALSSTTKGFLPPRMTTTQKNAIASPATGLMVYDTDLNRPCFYNGSSWITL
jgi:hypothetical protein